MFMPTSAPTETVDVVCESVIGRQDPLANMRYAVQPVTGEDHNLSSFVRSVFDGRGGVKSLLTSNSKLLASISEDDTKPDSSRGVSDAVLYAQLKEKILDIFENGVGHASGPVRSFEREGHHSNTEGQGREVADDIANIHSLGENSSDILGRNAADPNLLKGAFENGERVGVTSFETAAESSLRQNVFDLSAVFDPSNLKDVELFGLSDDEDDMTHSQNKDTYRNSVWSRLETENDDDSAGLDVELDAVIGTSYGVWDSTKVFNRTKWSSLNQKKPAQDDVWAKEDKLDVSDFAQLVPDMAIEYPFNLDVFQKRAVYRLERDENVFVAAHTSAGKTVVAEYAIALAMQRKTKVIYTSPIKTLSNQKFRDFSTRFGDVGIITGDISINPDAACLVMTTEILRSMLYKGADLIRDLSHVIFDECHWLNDPERGVVWEESIILLPKAVSIVMLSATVPNAMEFAKWVGRTKQKSVYVVHTQKRPVPLSHQVYVKGEVYALFDSSQGRFLEANYRRAATHHKEATKSVNVRFGGGRNHAWMPIIKFLQKRGLDPAIFFCFSKKKCDEAAEQLRTQDLTTGATDKNHIHMFYDDAIRRLSASDRNVPQITRHREMLKRGIGVHHAGILPIIKEATEVLFQQGLIRILFATETFAMGVNMPARTVVFTAIHKYDSQSHRLLEPGEYIQMAGRAGRRGLDDVGTVLLYPSAADFPVESDIKSVLTGTPKPLRSQFRLTYNMILNLLRIDELRVEDVMARSFSEAPTGRTSGTVRKLLDKGNKALDSLQTQSVRLERFRALYQLSERVDDLSKDIASTLSSNSKNSTKTLIGAGRIVLVRGGDRMFRVGVVTKAPMIGRAKGGLSLKGPRTNAADGKSPGKSTGEELKVLVLCGGPVVASEETPLFQSGLTRVDLKSKHKQYNAGGLIVEMRTARYEDIVGFSSLKIDINERALVPIRGEPNPVALSTTAQDLQKIAVDRSNWSSLPQLHPVKDLGLQDLDIVNLWEERTQSISIMNDMAMDLIANGAIANLDESFKQLSKESKLEHKLEMLKIATSDESLQLMPDYKQRVEVLGKLGYIDGTSVRLKGRAACEVNTCESIILTELVFEKILQKLSAVDLAALLCSLVFQEKVAGDETSYSQLDDAREQSVGLYDACKGLLGVLACLGAAQAASGLAVSASEYVRANANFGFIIGVRGWADGKSFTEICELCGGEVPEGTIVRTIVRLCELLRETKNVARVIGDPDLQAKAEEAMGLVRRDVIFAASLYIQ